MHSSLHQILHKFHSWLLSVFPIWQLRETIAFSAFFLHRNSMVAQTLCSLHWDFLFIWFKAIPPIRTSLMVYKNSPLTLHILCYSLLYAIAYAIVLSHNIANCVLAVSRSNTGWGGAEWCRRPILRYGLLHCSRAHCQQHYSPPSSCTLVDSLTPTAEHALPPLIIKRPQLQSTIYWV